MQFPFALRDSKKREALEKVNDCLKVGAWKSIWDSHLGNHHQFRCLLATQVIWVIYCWRMMPLQISTTSLMSRSWIFWHWGSLRGHMRRLKLRSGRGCHALTPSRRQPRRTEGRPPRLPTSDSFGLFRLNFYHDFVLLNAFSFGTKHDFRDIKVDIAFQVLTQRWQINAHVLPLEPTLLLKSIRNTSSSAPS